METRRDTRRIKVPREKSTERNSLSFSLPPSSSTDETNDESPPPFRAHIFTDDSLASRRPLLPSFPFPLDTSSLNGDPDRWKRTIATRSSSSTEGRNSYVHRHLSSSRPMDKTRSHRYSVSSLSSERIKIFFLSFLIFSNQKRNFEIGGKEIGGGNLVFLFSRVYKNCLG